MRLCDRITASWNLEFVTWPLRSTCMSQTKHRRSTFGFSEQMPLDRVSGSIGTTKPGKYTDVARFCASSSSGVSGRSEERRVGQEGVSKGRSRWWQYD